jgi:hypothetical protein
MGDNINTFLRLAIANQLFFFFLIYISDCFECSATSTPSEKTILAFVYFLLFAVHVILQLAALLGIFLTIFNKTIIKATQLNAFIFLTTLAVYLFILLDWYYASF